jgi:hypothetical protein
MIGLSRWQLVERAWAYLWPRLLCVAIIGAALCLAGYEYRRGYEDGEFAGRHAGEHAAQVECDGRAALDRKQAEQRLSAVYNDCDTSLRESEDRCAQRVDQILLIRRVP